MNSLFGWRWRNCSPHYDRATSHLSIQPGWVFSSQSFGSISRPVSSLTCSTACQDIVERPGADIASLGHTPTSFMDLFALLLDSFESALVASKFLTRPQMRLLSAILTIIPTV